MKMIPNKSTRKTTQRDLVYQEVLLSDDHPIAETIFQRVHAKNSKVSRSTVYRNLHVLVNQGKVLSITVPGGPEHFDRTTSAHYHVRCDVCGRVCDIEVCGEGESVVDAKGFSSLSKEVLYHGICPKCKSTQDA